MTAFVAMALVLITGGGDEAPAATPLTCNGYRVLCNRPLNDVALAATHNSMASTTIPRWLFAQQDGTISDQLNEGIHGLLIDSYYGFAEPNGIVRTDLARVPKISDLEQEIGPQATQVAKRIRSRLATEPARRARDLPLPRLLRARVDNARLGARRSEEVPGVTTRVRWSS